MGNQVFMQIPQDIPHQSEPVDFTNPWNIVVYIIVPIGLVILYLYWKKHRKK
ncbi:MAG: hypothetical protein MUC73_09865 [Cyclobacteriaceae bacterium]|jgi:hypothetical protein|nr:hypothetical protein [Cyclobacteriaceae bacterium]